MPSIYNCDMKQPLLVTLVALCGAVPCLAQTTNHLTVEELRQVRLPEVKKPVVE